MYPNANPWLSTPPVAIQSTPKASQGNPEAHPGTFKAFQVTVSKMERSLSPQSLSRITHALHPPLSRVGARGWNPARAPKGIPRDPQGAPRGIQSTPRDGQQDGTASIPPHSLSNQPYTYKNLFSQTPDRPQRAVTCSSSRRCSSSSRSSSS